MAKKRKNQARTEAKTEFIRKQLRENPRAHPNEIMAKVVEAFPSGNEAKPGGVSKVLISDIRWKEFGLRLGPGGRIFDRKGDMVGKTNEIPAEPAKTTSKIDIDASQKRLQALVVSLREEMTARNIERVDVPLHGNVSAVTRVKEDLAF